MVRNMQEYFYEKFNVNKVHYLVCVHLYTAIILLVEMHLRNQ
jgi:hypothetical protein